MVTGVFKLIGLWESQTELASGTKCEVHSSPREKWHPDNRSRYSKKTEVFHSYWRAYTVVHTHMPTTGIRSRSGVQGQPWVWRV